MSSPVCRASARCRFGAGEYAMRIWLDPNKVAARGLTASDVVSAMQEQNVQVSAGQLGAEPMPTRSDYLLSINARGRLQTEEEFGNIILKSGDNGEIVRLRDVARIEMGSGSYALRAQLNNKDAVGIGIFQSPGANAIELSDAVRGKMAELATRFPDGMSWKSPYDPTVFVRDSIRAVVDTLLEAVIWWCWWSFCSCRLARLDHSAAGGPDLRGRHLCRAVYAGLLAQYPQPVRAGAGDRHRGG